MKHQKHCRLFRFTALAALTFLCHAPAALAAEEAEVKTNVAPRLGEAGSEVQQVLQSYLQLQAQIHATQLSIERARQDAEAAARRNSEELTARLNTINQQLDAQKKNEQSSNRFMLVLAGAFAGLGLLTMLLTAFFQWRAMHRLTEVAAHLPHGGALAFGSPSAPGLGDMHRLAGGALEPANARFLAIIERLEKRIHELEASTSFHPAPVEASRQNGRAKLTEGPGQATESEGVASTATPKTDGKRADHVAMLLGKGQALLSMNQAENAVACFDEALAVDPLNAEALIKKGIALERLERNDEAMRTYDRAIEADSTMTLAWLHKGGLCNRLERHDDALECYEQALRAQEKHRAA